MKDMGPVLKESLLIFLICLIIGVGVTLGVVYIFGGLP